MTVVNIDCQILLSYNRKNIIQKANLKMNKLKEAKKLEAKKIIFKTALDLFQKQGYEHTSIQSICTSCGIAKGTFYNYFNSKEDIIRESYRTGIDEYIADHMNTIDYNSNPPEALHVFITISLNYSKQTGKKTTALAYICNLNSAITENTNILYDAHFNILKRIISAGKRQGCWKSNLTESQLLDTVTALINGLMIEYCFSISDYDIVEKNAAIIQNFVDHF